MPSLRIHQHKLTPEGRAQLRALCPFGALVPEGGALAVTAACKMCGLCVKHDPTGAMELVPDAPQPDAICKPDWRGIAVFAQLEGGALAPVVPELIGKARELAMAIRQPVSALLIGHQTDAAAQALLSYGVDAVYVYDDPRLAQFRVLPYAAVFEDFVRRIRPGSVLVGATNIGRSLAPRLAARFGTGLTADCTRLEMRDNTDLVQIRPAFGGNIMAQIVTPNHRPQFCTVRHKVFSAPSPETPHGHVRRMEIDPQKLDCAATVLEMRAAKRESDISEADVLVVAGRGIKAEKDLWLARELALALGAQMACTRPLVESGWFNPKRQIGLSGRTVAPKLLVALGVSGAVQFAAGIQNAGTVVAVNQDADAPIFDVAHYGFVGDVYEVVPLIVAKLKEKGARS